ncbi:MAG TPA: hypothetical protein PLJ44_06900 [Victivallales bacterium]|nr:hypothetical protein [Victivallales bacterium]
MQKRDKKILVISQSYPFPQRCGFTYRVGDMCKHLSKYFSIHIAVNEEKTPTPLLFSELFDGVHYPEKSEKKILFKEILKKTYLHLQQPHFDDIIYENHNFVELIKKLISIYKFSAIIINTPILGYCAKYIPDKILKIMDTHDIWYQKYLNLKKLGYGDLLSHFRDRNRELNLYRSFDLVLAISLSDLQYLQIHGIKNCIHTPPSFLPLSEPKKEKSSNNPILLYASGQGVFNIDAIEFFTKNILPIINEKIKDLKFKILNPSSELQKNIYITLILSFLHIQIT